MASAAFGRRLLSTASTSLRCACRPRAVVTRRGMASTSEAHGAKKSDTAWLIGSGTVTALGAVYLLTPPSKKAAHSAVASAHPLETAHNPASSEGAAARGERFTGETKARGHGDGSGEEDSAGAAPVTLKDSDGEEADIGSSVDQALDANAPKAAKAAEEDNTKYDDGAPGQTSAVHDEDKPEQNVKPKEKRSGTVQSEGSEGPTNMGDAREQAKGKNAPKEAAQD